MIYTFFSPIRRVNAMVGSCIDASKGSFCQNRHCLDRQDYVDRPINGAYLSKHLSAIAWIYQHLFVTCEVFWFILKNQLTKKL